MSRHGATPPRDPHLDAAEPQVPAVDQPADSARVNLTITPSSGSRAETVAIEIVRPAISAQVISHVTRNANIAKPAPVGENMQQSLPGGLVVMSSVTTVTEMVGAARRSVPVTQTPHYKVMVKGEAMPAKPGRADDFRWPRDPQSW